jgi:hypothetical protein
MAQGGAGAPRIARGCDPEAREASDTHPYIMQYVCGAADRVGAHAGDANLHLVHSQGGAGGRCPRAGRVAARDWQQWRHPRESGGSSVLRQTLLGSRLRGKTPKGRRRRVRGPTWVLAGVDPEPTRRRRGHELAVLISGRPNKKPAARRVFAATAARVSGGQAEFRRPECSRPAFPWVPG